MAMAMNNPCSLNIEKLQLTIHPYPSETILQSALLPPLKIVLKNKREERFSRQNFETFEDKIIFVKVPPNFWG